MAEKLFYTMGEVAEMFDVRASLIRHWESQFSVLRPKRNKKGNRLFSPADVEHLKVIYHLVKERGMTLEGAKKTLRQHRPDNGVGRDAELMERLQHIRSLLVEVREDLKAGADDILAGAGEYAADVAIDLADNLSDAAAQDRAGNPAGKRSRAKSKAVVQIAPGDDSAPMSDTEGLEADKCPAARRPRRKKEDAETKELFAFYEQSLF